MKDIYSQKWFHHFLSVEEVIRSLSDQTPGTFLVRFSRSKSDAFALEYVESKGKVRTVLIKNNMPQGVSIAEEHNVEKTFASVHQLVQHYADTLKFPFHSDLLHRNWFFGDTSSEEAEEMLFGRPVGTFMIRFADTGRFQFLASYVSRSGAATESGFAPYVRHVQIMKVPSGYSLSTEPPQSPTSSSSTTSAADELASVASVVFPSLPKLISACRGIFRYNYDADNVPRVRLAEFVDVQKPTEIEGPGLSDGVGVKLSVSPKVAGQTLASYPKGSLGWQVVCDQFKIRVMGNRVLFVLCDGCGWGPKPREAALRAANEIIEQMSDKIVQTKMEDTLDCKHFLLRSFSLAHEAIVKGRDDIWLAGTTTLLAGMLVQVHASSAADSAVPEWALVCASVGDCKCFVWNPTTKTAVDVTLGNRRNLRDASDPGGRIGPFVEPHGHPDLRNLAAYFWPLKPEEVVVAVSDGVHDNLEPECIALTPAQTMEKLSATVLSRFKVPSALPTLPAPPTSAITNTSLPPSTIALKQAWDALGAFDSAKLVERLKGAFMVQRMEDLLVPVPPTDLATICDILVQNAFQATTPSRTFMEANPDKSEPKDRLLYPGKMDHVTSIALACPASYYIAPAGSSSSSSSSTSGVVPSIKVPTNSSSSLASSDSVTSAGKKKGSSPRNGSAQASPSNTMAESSLRAEAEMLPTQKPANPADRHD